MSDSIDVLVDKLPTSGMTVRALGLLDFIAPGEWQNITGFDNTIRYVTGEQDPAIVAQIRARALTLYNDPSQGYQRAVSIYQMVDSAGGKIGLASMAHMLGEKVGILSFLSKLTPKEDKAQTVDLGLKLVAEMVAFCYANGFPGDGIRDFMGAVSSYEKENLIRLSGIVVFDGLIPLGPNYGVKLIDAVSSWTPSDLQGNALFQRIHSLLPGGASTDATFQFVNQGLSAMNDYVGGFAAARGITLDRVLDQMRGVFEFSEGKLDLLAAFLDISTSYMEHTGIQSVARSLIERSVGEI
ncbi:hypothetical protein [Bryobacter aggregatus]|uniref:hypothetical protein n=1 Tax=Bryobacter aggregatus TaxID=360054 RepID=UPI0004E0EC70|nr:hypothetical protein [Bryobacter aggregatus]